MNSLQKIMHYYKVWLFAWTVVIYLSSSKIGFNEILLVNHVTLKKDTVTIGKANIHILAKRVSNCKNYPNTFYHMEL